MGEHFLHESQTLVHLVTSLGDVAVTEKLKYIMPALPYFSLSLKNWQVPHRGETGSIDLKDGAGGLWERDWGTEGREVMRAHVRDGEVFCHGRLGVCPSFLSLELPVWSNETWRSLCPGEGGLVM